MTTFDSVPPDAPRVRVVSAKTFRLGQSWLPFLLNLFAIIAYFVAFLTSRSLKGRHLARMCIDAAFLCMLRASFARRVFPFLFAETGSYRYRRVGSVVTRLLPNTRQSWIVVMTLAALVVGLPLYMYLFTHFTVAGRNVYGFAMFGLSGSRGSVVLAFCIGLLLCVAVMAVTFALVSLPLGGCNPLHVAEPADRVRVWIRYVSWFPLTLILLMLFVFSRLVLCGGPTGRYAEYGQPESCGTGMHFVAGIFGWCMTAAAYICLDIGQEYVRLLGGGTVAYYALEPRLDAFFSELLVWTLKATAAMVTFVDPIGADVVAAVLFGLLFAFTFVSRTSTVEALEELMRWAMLVVAVTSAVSACLTSRRIPAAVPGLVILLCWVAAVAGATAMYVRRFGRELFGSGREVTADIIIV